MRATGVCSLADCRNRHKAHGLCQKHLNRARRADPNRPRCAVVACDRAAWAKRLCDRHYRQVREGRLTEAMT